MRGVSKQGKEANETRTCKVPPYDLKADLSIKMSINTGRRKYYVIDNPKSLSQYAQVYGDCPA